MRSCPEQRGADGRVLWLLQRCQRGNRKKQKQDEWISSILESDESSKERRKNWARLIQKIYEVDPLTCPQCYGKMKVISVIEDQDVIKKILMHLGLWQVKPRPPPRNAKSQPLSTEPHIAYSDSLVPSSDDGLYHLAFTENSRYVFGVEKHIALPFCFKRSSDLSC